MSELDPEYRRIVRDWEEVCAATWKAGSEQTSIPTLHLRMILHLAALTLNDNE
jgi:hypothetical protein